MEQIGVMVLAASMGGGGVLGTAISGIAAACCLSAGWSGDRRRFWWGLCAIQLLFTADAAFGLRNMAADAGREFFRINGIYSQRAWPQAVATVIGLVVVVIAAGWVLWRLGSEGGVRGALCRAAAAGTCLSLMIVVMTAVSLHGVEHVLGWGWGGVNVGNVMRGVGCVVTGGAAWRWIAQTPLRH